MIMLVAVSKVRHFRSLKYLDESQGLGTTIEEQVVRLQELEVKEDQSKTPSSVHLGTLHS